MIRNLSDPSQWRYVDTKENPADDASRGLDAKALNEQQRWLRGPKFLWEPEKDWPAQLWLFGKISNKDPEVKKQVNACVTTITYIHRNEATPAFLRLVSLKENRCSFLRVKAILQERRLKRISAKHGSSSAINVKARNLNEDHSSPTVQELEEAEHAIIHFTQSQSFDTALKSLDQASDSKLGHERTCPEKSKTEIRKTSSLYRLDPFVGGGLPRVDGQLNYADIPEESKHPIILH